MKDSRDEGLGRDSRRCGVEVRRLGVLVFANCKSGCNHGTVEAIASASPSTSLLTLGRANAMQVVVPPAPLPRSQAWCVLAEIPLPLCRALCLLFEFSPGGSRASNGPRIFGLDQPYIGRPSRTAGSRFRGDPHDIFRAFRDSARTPPALLHMIGSVASLLYDSQRAVAADAAGPCLVKAIRAALHATAATPWRGGGDDGSDDGRERP